MDVNVISKDFYESQTQFNSLAPKIFKLMKKTKNSKKQALIDEIEDLKRTLTRCVSQNVSSDYRKRKEFKSLKIAKRRFQEIKERYDMINLFGDLDDFEDDEEEDEAGRARDGFYPKDDEKRSLIRKNNLNRLERIKHLADTNLGHQRDLKRKLEDDTEKIQAATNTNNDISQHLGMADNYLRGILRVNFCNRLSLILIIVILGILDVWYIYVKIISRLLNFSSFYVNS